MTKLITSITITLFVLLYLAALALSYTGLMVTASNNGKLGWMAFIWPLLVDGAMVFFVLIAWHNSLKPKSIKRQLISIGLVSVVNIYLNVFQEAHWTTEYLIYSIPPLIIILLLANLVEIIEVEIKEFVRASVNKLTYTYSKKCIYLLRREDGIFKVGKTGNIRRRIRELQRNYGQGFEIVFLWKVPNIHQAEVKALNATKGYQYTEENRAELRNAPGELLISLINTELNNEN